MCCVLSVICFRLQDWALGEGKLSGKFSARVPKTSLSSLRRNEARPNVASETPEDREEVGRVPKSSISVVCRE